jgi:DNA polymerase-1
VAPFIWPVLLYRRIRYGYGFRRIRLTRGKYALVDPDDYRHLSKHKWHAYPNGKTFYAARRATINGIKNRYIPMHRAVLKVPANMFVDHINRNGLDNRKANLRPATHAQNSCNRAKRSNGTCASKYKGVTARSERKSYQAQIRVNGNPIFLGSFRDEVQAAKAYDRAAKKYHCQYAVLNFPDAGRRSGWRRGIVEALMRLIFLASPRLIELPAAALTAPPPINKVATMAKKLFIIDGHAHIYAAYYAKMRPLTTPTGEPIQATYIFTTAILGLIQRQRPDMLAVAMDSKAPTFRSEIYPEYKAQRPPMPDDMPVQISRIEEILQAMKIPVLRLDGFEADDIIGTLAKKAAADGYDCLICSGDKDMLQLLDDRISTFDIKTDTRTDVVTMVEQMGVTPAQFLDCLALQGDTSDNVPGIPDVGPKTALDWIRQYGSIENLLQHIDEIKTKRGDKLRKYKDSLALSKKLVTIDCDIPVGIDYDDLALKEFDREKLAGIFAELGFSRLLTQLGLAGEKPAEKPPAKHLSARRTADLAPRLGPRLAGTLTRGSGSKTVGHDYRLVDTQEKFDGFLPELKKQKLFAIDTETTSIHAMRADLVGISFSWKEHTGYYLPVKAPLGTKHLDIGVVQRELAPILADENIKKVGQNIKYDMLVLQNAGMPIKGIHFDTMVASYCLDPQRSSHSLDQMALDFLNYESIPISALIGKGKDQLTFDMVDTAAACEYSAEDADITFRLYNYLKSRLEKEPLLKKLFEEVEMPLVSVLAAMEHNGVSLDTALLRMMSGVLTEELKQVTDQIYGHAGCVFNIDSPKQLSEILFDRLGLKSARIGKAGRSTDAAVLEELRGEHPIIEPILQHRMLSKLRNTYVDKLGSLINPRTGRVHASFNQTITATGRLSSSDPNLQNIPIRTEIGSKVRSAFIPKDKSDCILSADYSQIELRLLAHFSKDQALMAAFAADQDIHRFVASQIYNVPIDVVTGEMRSRCKAVNFGIIYGQGAFGLSRSIGISQTEAKRFIDDYFARYSSIRKFMDDCIASAKRTGYAETILHRRREIPNLSSKSSRKRSQAERLAVNTVIQGSAADLIKIAMASIQRKIEKDNLPVKMILQVHDELVFELPAAQAGKHAEWIRKEMADAIALDVPLKVDVACGPTWLK